MLKPILTLFLLTCVWLVLTVGLAGCGQDPAGATVLPTPAGELQPRADVLTPTATPTLTPTPAPTDTRTPVPTPAHTLAPTDTPVSTGPPPPTSSPIPIPEPRNLSVQLPGDEGAHLTPVEWWYFNGHLTTESGLEYSFHFVTFQLVLPSGLTPRLAQLSWADQSKGIHLTAEQADLPLLNKSSGSFDLRLFNWSMSGDGSEYSLEFQTGDYDVALQATSQKPATLHNGNGLVDLGIAGKTYYYSRTNLKASAVVSVAGQPQQASGTAWMDHQWGDFSTRSIGWDWLSLNLDDGSELMVSVVWEQNGHEPITTYGTYVPQEGQAVHVPGKHIAFDSTGSWTSEATGAEYPMGWTLRVEPLEMDLTLTPVLTDAEFAVSAFIPVAYWEGAVAAEGVRGQAAITGNGFVEMVGYDAGSPGLAAATPGPR